MKYKNGEIKSYMPGKFIYHRGAGEHFRYCVTGTGDTAEEAYQDALKNAQEDVLELQAIIEEAECES